MKRTLFAIFSALFILASIASAQLPPDVSQPAPPVAPVVVTAAPTSPNSDLFTILWTVLGTIVVAILGYVSPAVKQALTAPGGAARLTAPSSVAATMVAALQSDPALRTQIMAELSRVISSGVPGAVLTAGAGLIPGASVPAALLEPMLRSAIMDAMAVHTAPATAAAVAPVTNQLTDLLSVVNGLRAQIEALVPKGVAP